MKDPQTAGKATSGLAKRLAFFKGLQALNSSIHATQNIDEIMVDVSADVCELFGAVRMTLYRVDETGQGLEVHANAGLKAAHNVRVPISERSIVGYCALHRRVINISDVYSAAELNKISPDLEFRRDLHERSGFHCRQMLVAPLVDQDGDRVLGVVQLMNTEDGGSFSSVEEEGILALAQTLSIAFVQRLSAEVPLRSKYDWLLRSQRLTEGELQRAADLAKVRGVSQESILIHEMGCTAEELGQSMSRFFGVPYEPYVSGRIRPIDLLRHIKREYAAKAGWLPLEETQDGLVVLAVDAEHVMGSRVVLNVFPNLPLSYRVTTETEFDQTVSQFFDQVGDDLSVGDLLSDLADEGEGVSQSDELSEAADNELVKLVNRIIIDAHRLGASDIHIEPRPGKEKTLVRLRRDGLLMPYIEVPASYRNAMVARIKIMCDLDISERRKPQDGKIRFRKYGPLDLELRVATIPTAGGMEDVVMRLLAQGEPIPLEKLALSDNNLDRLKKAVSQPHGIFFVCGPTGSGKTTTLHSVLRHINTPETKIWTAEDPVEITQKGLRQVQVNRKAGLDFPAVMRSFLRADPDVIMVGEMRDLETVTIGIEASLTGHLVMSTLHTNSAPESVVRLLDMGMDPFNFSDALLGVLAQRLTRRLCKRCAEPYEASKEEIAALLDEYCEDLRWTPDGATRPDFVREKTLQEWRERFSDEQGKFHLARAVGCPDCSSGGYRGRVALHELMLGSDAVRRLVQTRAPVSELLKTALHEGMRTLRQDGIEKVLSGITDMVQVRKVCIR